MQTTQIFPLYTQDTFSTLPTSTSLMLQTTDLVVRLTSMDSCPLSAKNNSFFDCPCFPSTQMFPQSCQQRPPFVDHRPREPYFHPAVVRSVCLRGNARSPKAMLAVTFTAYIDLKVIVVVSLIDSKLTICGNPPPVFLETLLPSMVQWQALGVEASHLKGLSTVEGTSQAMSFPLDSKLKESTELSRVVINRMDKAHEAGFISSRLIVDIIIGRMLKI